MKLITDYQLFKLNSKKLIFITLVLTFLSFSDSLRVQAQSKLNNMNSLQSGLENTYQNKSANKLKMIVLNGILGKDVGSGIQDATWICGMDGRVYRYDPMNVVHNVLNQPPCCMRIDTDYEGLPWIVTGGHQVWRMMHEYTENFRWVKLEGKFFVIFRLWGRHWRFYWRGCVFNWLRNGDLRFSNIQVE